MSDLVQRLRRWAHSGGCGCTRCTAANEIERLTDELNARTTECEVRRNTCKRRGAEKLRKQNTQTY